MSTQVSEPSIADLSVSTAKLQAGAVTAAKLASTLDLSGKTLTLPASQTTTVTKAFTSSAQTITSAGLLTIPHAMTVAPKLIQTSLVCQTGEAGYSAADEVLCNLVVSDGTRQSAIYWDVTNIYIRQSLDASLTTVANKTTGAVFAITNANWKLVVRAFA